MGRFHQTLCAKRKDTGAQHLAKNLPFNFTNLTVQQSIINCGLKLCAIRQTLCPEKSFSSVRAKSRAKMLMKSTPAWCLFLRSLEMPSRCSSRASTRHYIYKLDRFTKIDWRQADLVWVYLYNNVKLIKQILYYICFMMVW